MATNSIDNPVGLVLSGGASSRMGKDKGLLMEGDLSWVQKAYSTLKAVLPDVYVSVNSGQFSLYNKQLSADILIQDAPLAAGPLRGILSAYAQLEKDLLVLAVDMREMQAPPLIRLLDARAGAAPAEGQIIFYENQGRREPLCALYRASMLQDLTKKIKGNEIQKYGLQRLADAYSARILEVEPAEEEYFRNFNRPEDI